MGWPPEGVKPLARRKRADLRRPAPSPQPRQTQLDNQAVLAESLGPISLEDAPDTGDELSFGARDVVRKLRRGHWKVQDEFDLHGLNRRDALLLTKDFFGEAMRRGLRCVRLVHGKGLGSPQRESVLKGVLRRWLPQQPEILAYAQAPATQGGSGAVLLLLKPQPR
jgi:DNA-nicking Smr family endonuclease